MVLKAGVLRGIENLEQSGGRIAMKTGAELVDFIQHEARIFTAGFFVPLNDITRQRADVGAPMAANIRLVVHAANTLAHEFTLHRPRDTLPQGSLTNSWRAHST